MRMYRLSIDGAPGGDDDHFDVVARMDGEELAWSEMIEYLDRLTYARVIDEWDMEEHLDPETPGTVMAFLIRKYDGRLEEVEGGYELGGGSDDGGDDPVYRKQMTDAGRGALLR